jgi:hypothetical protein
MKRRTLRGQVDQVLTVKRLIADDGRLTSGYRVLEFHVWPDLDGNNLVTGVLGLDYDMEATANAGDNRQIAWAMGSVDATGTNLGGQKWTVIDPDHIVIQDLYIICNADVPTNYMVVLEPVELSNDQSILTLIKERSQDDLR